MNDFSKESDFEIYLKESIEVKNNEECKKLISWIYYPGIKQRIFKKRQSRVINELVYRMRHAINSHLIWEYIIRAKQLGVIYNFHNKIKLREIAIHRLNKYLESK